MQLSEGTTIAQAAARIVPSLQEIKDKISKPNCTECWGCSTRIAPLKDINAFGRNFTVELGASSEWLFYAGGAHASTRLQCTHSTLRGPLTGPPSACFACCTPQHSAGPPAPSLLPPCFADLPDTHITGRRAIVKVWCFPMNKVGELALHCSLPPLHCKPACHTYTRSRAASQSVCHRLPTSAHTKLTAPWPSHPTELHTQQPPHHNHQQKYQ